MTMRRTTGQVNMTDVAIKAGVSQSTVSRVINNHPGISRQTRETVLEALRLLGYKSEVMNLMRPEKEENFSISLVMCPLPEQRDPFALDYFSTLATGVREGMEGVDVDFRLQTLAAEAENLPEIGPHEGLILVGYPSAVLRKTLRKEGIPYVVASGDIYDSNDDMVTVNNFEAGAEACRYLLDRGVRRIGFLLSPHNLVRYAGFQTELLRRGLPVAPEDFRLLPSTDLTVFIEAIHHWIAEKNLPEALVVSFYDAGRTAQTMLQLNGIRVPEDIRIVAFDHRPGKHSELISLHSDPYRIGYRAARLLLEKLRGGDASPIQVIVPMTLTAPEK